MSIFNKVCLVVGKIVVFFIAFLSCFYTVDLLCTYLKPLVDSTIIWFMENRVIVILSSFSLIATSGILIYVFTDGRYKKMFSPKQRFHSKVKDKDKNKSSGLVDELCEDLSEEE